MLLEQGCYELRDLNRTAIIDVTLQDCYNLCYFNRNVMVDFTLTGLL